MKTYAENVTQMTNHTQLVMKTWVPT